MSTQLKQHTDVTTIQALSGVTTTVNSTAFPFEKQDFAPVGFLLASIVSNTQALTCNLQHSMDQVVWANVCTFSLTTTGSALGYESTSVRPIPLLPYGRAQFSLTANANTAEWKEIRLDYLTDKK